VADLFSRNQTSISKTADFSVNYYYLSDLPENSCVCFPLKHAAPTAQAIAHLRQWTILTPHQIKHM